MLPKKSTASDARRDVLHAARQWQAWSRLNRQYRQAEPAKNDETSPHPLPLSKRRGEFPSQHFMRGLSLFLHLYDNPVYSELILHGVPERAARHRWDGC